ncbi:pyridoxamine 5'-phosphate oxidase family protein [Desulforhopalus vacuolatus]|uniref:pyridoxamine 5'-phosphate oxidase family protein n=1 Tax=Desulforhopalus vacuolatus TaxID=40414 RepID=UPI00196350E6|nr:pyridoxamine 5'-phosphate oxidase family protein [Desulforhopalus vacuolatus]MBM9520110.1 pyridoxamine 5'-phosphate oxidase family protein [Desulforhopalus vacuolatus]
MAALPEAVSKEWENREGPCIFATIDSNGHPNAIYVTCISKFNEDTILIANNFFSKTLENILSGSKGSILFITKEKKSYQIKGSLEYHDKGPVFDDMKKWNPAKLPGHGAVAIKVEEVYKGAEKLL